MKTTQKLAAILTAVCLSLPAAAEENGDKSGFFVAPEVGNAKIKGYCKDARDLLSATSCEDSEIVFGVSGGYQFNEFFAADAGVRFASGFDVVAGNGARIDADFLAWSLGGRGRFPIGSHFAIVGKAGFHFWEVEFGGPGGTADLDDTDPYFGGGVEFFPADNIAIRAEYTRYKLDDDDADVISGAVVVRF